MPSSDKNQQASDSKPAQERRKRRADGKSADKHPPRGVASGVGWLAIPRHLGNAAGGAASPQIAIDAKGNAIWHWKTEEPRRREEDPTIDLLECLTSEQLALNDPDEEPPAEGFNPYDHTKKR